MGTQEKSALPPASFLSEDKAKGRKQMKILRTQDWIDNLHNAAQGAGKKYGNDAVEHYLKEHFGVSSLEELSPTDYDRAFDDLDQMSSD